MTNSSTSSVFQEPCFDLAHLAHVEMLTPTPEKSLWFFTEVMGLTVSATKSNSVYLRGWDDYEHHTLKLTGSNTSGIKHHAFRTTSQAALERRVEALKRHNTEFEWTEGDLGHGPACRFRNPDGHVVELYYDTQWYQATDGTRPSLKNQAARIPGRGANLRRLDHLNLLASDVKKTRIFMQDVLGCRLTEQIVFNDGSEKGAWFSVNNKSYDLAISEDHSGSSGRFHHMTYAVDSREEVLRAADICLDNGVYIETGPHKHAVQQTFFLYV
ncbi:VOC family protein [Larsenimonas salina]|uniref:VOC family protein n=1 Tax=Larsenimonas salina TaxID=1295565 RepID=UPI002074170E|nr:VOC family protein [Larsenimonas salina]MCM5704679.1 VOC family protein [Larsenimonas salina]